MANKTKATKPSTQSGLPSLNLLGFTLASIGIIFLAEVSPQFGVGVMTVILAYEVMTHPSNLDTLSKYLGGK